MVLATGVPCRALPSGVSPRVGGEVRSGVLSWNAEVSCEVSCRGMQRLALHAAMQCLGLHPQVARRTPSLSYASLSASPVFSPATSRKLRVTMCRRAQSRQLRVSVGIH